jgi:transcriptional regulator with XRE-family HTH domain
MTDDKDNYENILKPVDFDSQQPDITAIELRRAREAKGFSHTDLHRMTGISRSVLSGYETGRTRPGTKELRLLASALQVNPNRLLLGTDEPFKPRTGLRSLVKLRNSPLGIVAATIFVPIVFASLDDDQLEAVLTLLASLIEARNPEASKQITAFAEVMGELIGDGSPEALATIAAKAKDQEFMDALAKKIEAKVATME